MREAIDRIKNVVAKKDIVPILTHFISRDGMLYAGNGNLSAATPFPIKKTFCVKADGFQNFLDKTPGEVQLEVLENHHVRVKCGRYRATIPGIEAPAADTNLLPTGKAVRINENFLSNLNSVRPFLSDNATQPWASCASIQGQNIFATNNVSIVRAVGTGAQKDANVLITFEAIDFILSRPEGLESYSWDERSILFRWKDKSWLKAPMLETNYPNVEPIFQAAAPAKWAITDEWRESFLHVCSITEGNAIEIHQDKITAVSDSGAEIVAEVKKGPPMTVPMTKWQVKYAQPVIENATHITITAEQGFRMSFKTENITGIFLGMDR